VIKPKETAETKTAETETAEKDVSAAH